MPWHKNAEFQRQKTALGRYIVVGLIPLAITLPLWVLRDALTTANVSLVFLLVVLIVAIFHGTGPSMYVAFISFLCFNYFLVKPLYTFLVADTRDVLDLVIYLLSAAITGQLASYARRQKRNAQQKAKELNILYEAAAVFNQRNDVEGVITALKETVSSRLPVHTVELIDTIAAQPDDTDVYVSFGEKTAALNVLHVAFEYPPPASLRQLVMACTSQAAIALQRIDLAQRAQQSKTFEDADRLKTALLHSVSHDLKTPITIIKTSANTLSHLEITQPGADRREMLEGIEAEADHLNEMVSNLLDISRLKAGVLPINKELNSLEEVVNHVAGRVWQTAHAERLEIAISDAIPLIPFDYGLILQALSNLVDNALRYEPAQSRIKIQGRLQEQAAYLAVINHGPNIDPDERDKIMEPFYHGKGGRIGLGLAIAKGIIEAHLGRIWIEDTPGGGATFIFTLPLPAKTE